MTLQSKFQRAVGVMEINGKEEQNHMESFPRRLCGAGSQRQDSSKAQLYSEGTWSHNSREIPTSGIKGSVKNT